MDQSILRQIECQRDDTVAYVCQYLMHSIGESASSRWKCQ